MFTEDSTRLSSAHAVTWALPPMGPDESDQARIVFIERDAADLVRPDTYVALAGREQNGQLPTSGRLVIRAALAVPIALRE